MANTQNNGTKKRFGVLHVGMTVCCAVMLIPVAGFLIAGGSIAGPGSNLAVFAPIALCIGVHAVMFRVMGKSCHSTPAKPADDASFEDADPVPVPAVAYRP